MLQWSIGRRNPLQDMDLGRIGYKYNMPRVSDIPLTLKPFVFHGVMLETTKPQEGVEQIKGVCPFCMKENKFYINVASSKWDCKSCGRTGNGSTFIQQLWEASENSASIDDYRLLADNRGLLDPDTLVAWGVRKSITTGEWLIPGHNTDGKLSNLYRYSPAKAGGKRVLLPTPTMKLHLTGVPLIDSSYNTIWICEKPWDGMIAWETNQLSKYMQEANVVAPTSCSTFDSSWLPLFSGRKVCLLYDNDHPREVNGHIAEPAGYAGMKRSANMLANAKEITSGVVDPPSEIHYIQWGKGVENHNTELPNGYDVRDYLKG